MSISKIEAARRQLDVAILLFFEDADWIAVHTLAAASGRVLRDLAEQRGSSAWERLNSNIIPERRNEFWRHVNRVANFFKHADRDPHLLLGEIDPMLNDHFILTHCLLFVNLEKYGTRPMSAFLGWYTGAYPETFLDQGISTFAQYKHLAISVHQGLHRGEQLAFWHAILKAPSV